MQEPEAKSLEMHGKSKCCQGRGGGGHGGLWVNGVRYSSVLNHPVPLSSRGDLSVALVGLSSNVPKLLQMRER